MDRASGFVSTGTVKYSYLERKTNEKYCMVVSFQPPHFIFAALVLVLLLVASVTEQYLGHLVDGCVLMFFV